MRVLVGMSGGVDSSVAAILLKEEGFEVVGATMSIWGKNGIFKKLSEKNSKIQHKSTHGACLGPNEKEDIDAARNVCKQLGIEFYVFDCAKQYEEIVLKNFRHEYLAGRTPNPCIWCNSLIKFDILPKLALLNGIQFDKFATGHYAKIARGNNGEYLLQRGKDSKKDQSYFLYRLTQEQLKKILLPLGNYTKEDIRNIAKKYNLNVAQKPDSQDFYEGDYNELLQVKEKTGNIVNENGKILGQHNGIWNYTIGQRKGLKISASEPLYVTELREESNEVVVGFKNKTMKNKLIAKDINWISGEITSSTNCLAKIRSSQAAQDVIITPINKNSIEVEFINLQKSIAPGQSVVLYNGETVLGGGIIEKVL